MDDLVAQAAAEILEAARPGCRRRAACTATVLRPASVAVSDRFAAALRRAPEHRRVAALGQVDDQLVAVAFVAVVAGEPRAQPAGLDADDRIGARIEGRFLAEDLHADDVFLQIAAAARRRFRSTMKLMKRLSRSTWEKVLLARMRLSCWRTALSDDFRGRQCRRSGSPSAHILPRVLKPAPWLTCHDVGDPALDCLDGVVLPLPIFASGVLTCALVFHLLVVDHVADFFLDRALDALTGGRSLFGNRIRA